MSIKEVFIEIFKNYQTQYVRNNKTSNEYFKDLKNNIRDAFKPYLEKYGFSVNPLGGQAIMRKNPFISILASGHKTNRGIYPVYHFNFDEGKFYLGIGDADDNEPPGDLTDKFAKKSRELLEEFPQQNSDGYPLKVYNIKKVKENELISDLEKVLEVYLQCLEIFDEEIETYLTEKKALKGIKRITKYWQIAPGENARLWDEFKQTKSIRVGWDKSGDLSKVQSEDELDKLLIKWKLGDTRPKRQTRYLWNFLNGVRPGDYVVANNGKTQIVGIGKVNDKGYRFDNNVREYKHFKGLDWMDIHPFNINKNDRFGKTIIELSKEEFEDIISQSPQADMIMLEKPPNEAYTVQDAIKVLFLDEKNFGEILNILRYKKNIILQGPPGVGKSYIAKRLAYALVGFKDDEKVQMIQFHQSYSYEDFIQGFRPGEDGKFQLKNGIFYEFCRKARQDLGNPYIFIIDEINRGNLSKIFGELMLLIEADKRGTEFGIPLTYSKDKGDKFDIPENIHLIGMMNTADRSLAMVDYALRRRFDFIDLKPEFNSPKFKQYLIEMGVLGTVIEKIIDRMNYLNDQISEDNINLGQGYCIGHSFFCPEIPSDGYGENWYTRIITYEIAPLLREYWFDKADKAESLIEHLRR